MPLQEVSLQLIWNWKMLSPWESYRKLKESKQKLQNPVGGLEHVLLFHIIGNAHPN
jgi:hypothetical protein